MSSAFSSMGPPNPRLPWARLSEVAAVRATNPMSRSGSEYFKRVIMRILLKEQGKMYGRERGHWR